MIQDNTYEQSTSAEKLKTVRTKGSISLLVWIISFEAIAWLIGTVTQAQVDGWYQTLTKPPFTPPDISFAIIWPILYALIAASGWYLWRRRTNEDIRPLWILFIIYMGFNWAYMFVFFTAEQILAGLLWLIVTVSLSLTLLFKSYPVARPVSYLMALPTIWTLYAAYLNGGIWLLN